MLLPFTFDQPALCVDLGDTGRVLPTQPRSGAACRAKLNRFRTDLGREPTPREQWRLEREAVLDSRPAKTHSHSSGELREARRTRAAALGYEPHDLVAGTVGRVRRPAGIDQAMMAGMVEAALEVLRERQSTWRPAELVRELAARVPTIADSGVDDVQSSRVCTYDIVSPEDASVAPQPGVGC
jgi:hypothetical protein